MSAPFDPRLRVPQPAPQAITEGRRVAPAQDPIEKWARIIGGTANGSQQVEQVRLGFNGVMTSALIVNIGNNDIQPGDAWGVGHVYRGLFTDPEQPNQGRLYELCRGPVTQARGPSGYGSLPVQASDLLNLTMWFRVGGQWGLRITGLRGISSLTTWYSDILDPSEDLQGRLLDQSLGDPGAGSDYTTEAVPSNVNWLVKSIRATLVTDGTVADRDFYVEIRDGGGDVKYRSRLHDPQQAGETRQYNFAIGGTPYHATEDGNGDLHQQLPVIWLDEGYDLNFTTTNLQAGDNFGEGFLEVKERLMCQ